MSSPVVRKGLVAVAGLLLAIGVAVVVLVLVGAGSTRHHRPIAVHVAAPPPPPPPPPPAPPKPPPKPRATDDPWPLYGYDLARTRLFPNGAKLDPPLQVGWRFHDGALLEFPPVIYDNTLYFEDANGWASALSSTNGRLIWHRRIGTLAAASPALDIRHKLVFFPLLSRTPGAREPGNGAVVAVSMGTGKVAWSHSLPGGSESSPLVHGLSVFLGDQGGTVYSFRTYDGHVNWTAAGQRGRQGRSRVCPQHDLLRRLRRSRPRGQRRQRSRDLVGRRWGQLLLDARGGVRAGVHRQHQWSGVRVVGEFRGHFVDRSDGRIRLRLTGGRRCARLGAYGVHRLLRRPSVRIRRHHRQPAVESRRRGQNRRFGHVVGNVVYYSSLGSNTTTGLNWRTGRQVFSYPDGEFTPVITDGKVVFLIGYSTIYQMVPRH